MHAVWSDPDGQNTHSPPLDDAVLCCNPVQPKELPASAMFASMQFTTFPVLVSRHMDPNCEIMSALSLYGSAKLLRMNMVRVAAAASPHSKELRHQSPLSSCGAALSKMHLLSTESYNTCEGFDAHGWIPPVSWSKQHALAVAHTDASSPSVGAVQNVQC